MRMKFTGDYTCGRKSITMLGVTFHGYEPTDVPAEVAAKLATHPEFAEVKPRGKAAKKVDAE